MTARKGAAAYGRRARIERTDGWLFRWRVRYPAYGPDDGMDLETLHFTRFGARLSMLWSRA